MSTPATVPGLEPSAVKVHREGRGPALVLLHCLGVDHGLWDLAAAGLEDSYSLVTYDFPGHHESPVPSGAYLIEDLSRQLLGVLDREGIAKAHVAGISLGGLVAQHFAATQPARIEKLVLIDTTPRYVEEARDMWITRAHAARSHGVPSLIDGLLKIWFTDACVAANTPAVHYVRDRFNRCSGEGYAKACEVLRAAELRPVLAQITARTLVLCGKDEMPPFKEAAEYLASHIKDARLEWLSPAKHASVLEQPAQFQKALRAFLAT